MSDVTEETGGRRGGRRGGGRAGRQAARTASVATKPYLERTMPPVEMLSEDGLAAICLLYTSDAADDMQC